MQRIDIVLGRIEGLRRRYAARHSGEAPETLEIGFDAAIDLVQGDGVRFNLDLAGRFQRDGPAGLTGGRILGMVIVYNRDRPKALSVGGPSSTSRQQHRRGSSA